MGDFRIFGLIFCLFLGQTALGQSQQVPSRSLKIGARNSTIRNIGSLQVDSAFIFPKRLAKDTSNSKALKRKGAFFYDSSEHVVWFYNGSKFRRIDSGTNIYTSDGKIEKLRTVEIDGAKKVALKFVKGAVHFDTLLVKKRDGLTTDSFLTRFHDTVRYVGPDSLPNIYNKDGSLKGNREVNLGGQGGHSNNNFNLKFKGGAVIFDTLLLRNRKLGNSGDSLLVVRNDSVYRIARDSVFNIYNKSDSIKENRVVTLSAKNNAVGKQLYFAKGSVVFDTLLLKKSKIGTSRDTLLVRFKDTVKYIPFDSLRNIYTKSDSIKEARVVTLRGRQNGKASIYFKDGQFLLDTLLLRKKIKGSSRDSFLVMHKDTLRYIPFDSLRSIYTKSDSIKENRVVTLEDRSHKSQQLHFAKGSVHIDTLLVRPREGRTTDSFLTRFHDTVRYVSADSLPNIYNKDDTLKSNRVVYISKKDKRFNLHFTKGAVIFDTLLLRNRKLGNSGDSFLVVRNDSVYRIGRDSVFNIYTKSDSIKENRVVTLRGRQNGKASIYFKDGQFLLDTLLLRKKIKGSSRDSFLVMHKDTVRYIPFDSLRNIYNVDDSIKKDRIVTLADSKNSGKKLHFAKGSVHIDTLLVRPREGRTTDSFLTRFHDTVRYVSADSLPNIYNKDGKLRGVRIVDIDGAQNKQLKFVKGRVELDTLFLRHLKEGSNEDSLLTVKNDTVRKIKLTALSNIYTKSDSIKETRTVTLASAKNKPGTKLHFTQGAVHIDTLLLRNGKLGNSGDSLLVVRNDSVYRIGRDSVFNIYNKSDSIREYRIVTIRNHNKQKDVKLAFKDGRVEIDTLLIRKRRLGLSKDSFLTVWNDTVRSVPYDSLWNIYTKDDSIRNVKNGKRVIDLNNHSIVFKSTVPNANNNSGSNTNNENEVKGHSRFGILQENPKYTLDIATPQFLQAHDNKNANSADSIAVRIQHVVRDYKYGYGVLLSEFSNKAKGMSSLGFQGWRNDDNTASNQEVDQSKTYMKSAIWSQVGARRRHPILGFSVSDTNYNLKRRMFINSQGNVIIGEYKDVDNELDNTPARLVVNSSSFEGSLKLNGINPEDVSILTNGGRHTNDSRYRIKYGLVMKENSYDMGSRVAMAFYGGGNTNSARRESSSMAARIWASMGSEIANPEFGIDVGSGTAINGEALNSYTPNQITSMPNRLYINKWGNIGMGHQAPKTNVEISRANNNNVLRVHAGGHNKTNWQSALWLTVKDSDTGWYMGHTAQSGILKFTYTNKREGDNSSNVQGHMGQYTNTNEKLKNVLALIPKPDGGHIGIGTQSYVQDNIFIDVQRQDKANFLRIQAGSTNQENTLCGLWLSEHNILYGWRVQYNPQNDQLQFKQTSSDAYGDGNSSGVNIYFDGRGSNTAIVTPTVRNTSDSTLKKHIRKLTADLPDKLMQIRPVSYYWKDDSLMLPTSIRYGFLAQEIQKIFPNLVSTDTVEGKARMSMNYLDLISPMVAMLQKHEKKAQAQESKLAELKQQVTNLQSVNEALQKQNQRQEQRLNELERQMQELRRLWQKPVSNSAKNESMIER